MLLSANSVHGHNFWTQGKKKKKKHTWCPVVLLIGITILFLLPIYFWEIVEEPNSLKINFLKAKWPNDQLTKFFKFNHLPKAYFQKPVHPKSTHSRQVCWKPVSQKKN